MIFKSPRELRLELALQTIKKWIGEFPDTGEFWDKDKTRPISYGEYFGKNSERDFMREVASNALVPKK